MQAVLCKNCGTQTQGKFCSECGQQHVKRYSVKHILNELFDYFFSYESPFIKLVTQLTINPGKVYQDYLQGARQRYASPVRYSLWVLTLLVTLAGLTDTVLVDLIGQLQNSAEEMPVGLEQAMTEFQYLLNALIIPLYFVTSFVLAAFLRLLHKSQRQFSVGELTIPCLLSHSHLAWFTCLTLLMGIYAEFWTQMVALVLSYGYMIWGLSKIYLINGKPSYFRSIVAMALTFIAFILVLQVVGFCFGFVHGYLEHQSVQH